MPEVALAIYAVVLLDLTIVLRGSVGLFGRVGIENISIRPGNIFQSEASIRRYAKMI